MMNKGKKGGAKKRKFQRKRRKLFGWGSRMRNAVAFTQGENRKKKGWRRGDIESLPSGRILAA